MRSNAADEHVVSIQHKMLHRDRRGKIGACTFHVLCRVPGRDMLHDHAETGRRLPDRVEHLVYEHSLAVKNVYFVPRHLSVHAKRQTNFGHDL